MTSLAFASYLLCLFLLRTVLAGFLHVSQEEDFISTDVGGTVTLSCFNNQSTVTLLSWYKQPLGQKLSLVAKFYKYNKEGEFSDEYKSNPRYLVDYNNGKFYLKISDLQFSDSATYFCLGSTGHLLGFGKGTTVIVKGSGLNVKVLVHKSESEMLQPQDNAASNCIGHTGSSKGTQHVYWYKSSEELNPGLVYVNEDNNDQSELKPKAQKCVYHQPIESWNQTHTGNNFCPVALCGHVLFGDGIKQKSKDETKSPISLMYILIGALVSTTTVSLLLAFLVFKLKKKDYSHSTTCQAATMTPATSNVEGNQEADDLNYAALRKQTSDRHRRKTEDTLTSCVYASVKQ